MVDLMVVYCCRSLYYSANRSDCCHCSFLAGAGTVVFAPCFALLDAVVAAAVVVEEGDFDSFHFASNLACARASTMSAELAELVSSSRMSKQAVQCSRDGMIVEPYFPECYSC